MTGNGQAQDAKCTRWAPVMSSPAPCVSAVPAIRFGFQCSAVGLSC
ncbi:hypothetical protein HMPREF3196_00059 [Bifidobacterium bifidum]|uniref:Uncharacterized protein n=1 Tax=Bifidobacterium bifidum TaxID=1681 RepID=A0A133KTZ8_BIFBI|nr:hypothetical protein HMPREF3196_00059 [Bifidobacterium bifidum]